jgi:hypothetical protein
MLESIVCPKSIWAKEISKRKLLALKNIIALLALSFFAKARSAALLFSLWFIF